MVLQNWSNAYFIIKTDFPKELLIWIFGTVIESKCPIQKSWHDWLLKLIAYLSKTYVALAAPQFAKGINIINIETT